MKTTNIRKKIALPHGMNKILAKKLGYSVNTVTAALNCRTNTRKANIARREALKMGGVVMEVKESVII
jgi:hypothetical protein